LRIKDLEQLQLIGRRRSDAASEELEGSGSRLVQLQVIFPNLFASYGV
jgi:hypothetical protein